MSNRMLFEPFKRLYYYDYDCVSTKKQPLNTKKRHFFLSYKKTILKLIKQFFLFDSKAKSILSNASFTIYIIIYHRANYFELYSELNLE